MRPETAAAMRARLLDAGISQVVVWRHAYRGGREEIRRDERALALVAGADPWYDDGDGLVYRLR